MHSSVERLISAVEAAADSAEFPCEVHLASPSHATSWTFSGLGCDDVESLLDDLQALQEVAPDTLRCLAEDDETWIEFTYLGDDPDAALPALGSVSFPLYEE